MKRKLMQFLMLSGFLLTSSTALADYEPTAADIAAAKAAAKAVAIEDFQFSGNYYATEVGNMRFDFDTTNKLANFIGYSGENQAPEEFTVPEYVVYNDELYIVASVGGDYYYWYYYYEQPQVKKLTLPETVRYIRQYFYHRYDSVHEFEIPASVERIDGNIIDRENVTFSFKGAIVPNVTGYLYNNSSSKNKLKLRVPKASMKDYYQDLYLEKCCIVADDFTYDTAKNSSTIVVDAVESGMLGYYVVGSEILQGNPEGKVYSDVNKLIVKSGQIDATDWEAIRKDMDKRPVQFKKDGKKLAADGSSSKEEICSALAYYGIYNNKVVLWGTGTPLREFLWSEDMADASVHILLNVNFSDIIGIEKYSSVHHGASASGAVDRNNSEGRGGAIPSLGEIRNCHINVGTGKELTIKELSELVVKAVGFEGEVEFDTSKPDGTMRKLIDVGKLHSLGWTHKIEIEDGVQKLFDWYKQSLQ